jgi:type I restriction enzyme S subunit
MADDRIVCSRIFRANSTSGAFGSSNICPVASSGCNQGVLRSDSAYGWFDAVTSPILDLIKASIHESRRLAALRDYLLPRLLSGKVRVREAAGRA